MSILPYFIAGLHPVKACRNLNVSGVIFSGNTRGLRMWMLDNDTIKQRDKPEIYHTKHLSMITTGVCHKKSHISRAPP